jgi:hypothetical protein
MCVSGNRYKMDGVNLVPMQAMKKDGGVQMKLHLFLTSKLERRYRAIIFPSVLRKVKHNRYTFKKRLSGFQKFRGQEKFD